MEGRGGCCIARYAGVYDVSKMDQIMLRFRPIAPKPSASGAVPGGSKAAESDSRYLRTGRGRRRKNCNNVAKKENNKSSSSNSGDKKRCRKRKSGFREGNTEKLSSKVGVQDNTVVTLPLLPETPDLTANMKKWQKAPVMLSFDGSSYGEGEECYGYPSVRGSVGDGRVGMWTRQKRVVGSWVIVERVTDTWAAEEEGMPLGRTDEEKRRVLEEDTCPGFVSDCWNRVWWTNKAYKKTARERGGRKEAETTSLEEEEEVVVWLVIKEKLPVNCEGFTCRVTVQSTWNQLASTATVPCDVWRLSDGGFAWRLDVKAALSLGR